MMCMDVVPVDFLFNIFSAVELYRRPILLMEWKVAVKATNERPFGLDWL